ncbi:hypothetical protein JTE90_015720 [Oedothorax gibbosus]|uniref:Integrase catalytic domain-containing protein n=1 Tax=Oedothorax gibbosus TaxID=931172 RepID=A0AAV6TYW1_9ARAC|nr:hypothetical protein JTE90_015720 [Oedothorax gibbosus]
MVEQMHRPLKAAIKAYNTPRWTSALPTILLGFRTALREDLQASTSELVYGRTLRLPGEFFEASPREANAKQMVEDLNDHFNEIRPVPTKPHGRRSTFVHPSMKDCTHIFLRRDAVKGPLQSVYEGPYKILKRTEKTLELEVKKDNRTVSLDRVKPAFLAQRDDTIQESMMPGVPAKPTIPESATPGVPAKTSTRPTLQTEEQSSSVPATRATRWVAEYTSPSILRCTQY